jgi:tetratricopeptide (TPR) repeat protein
LWRAAIGCREPSMKKNRSVLTLLFCAVASLPLYAEGIDRIFHFDNDWVLKIDLKKFSIQKNEYVYERSFRNIYAFRDNGLIVSVFVEPAAEEGDSTVARQYYTGKLSQSPLTKTQVKVSEKGEIAFYEYFVPKFRDQDINQQHMNMYIARDNLWIDIHISKVNYSHADRALFDAVINSVKIEPKSAYDYFAAGSYMYRDKKYANAVKYYSSALDLEARKRTLENDVWYALVDNLGISLVLSGDAAKAKEVFLFGIKKNPDYALFYYNLACTFGEESDTANAVKYLKQAKSVAKKTGLKLPDAKTDTSFDKIRGTKEFSALMD